MMRQNKSILGSIGFFALRLHKRKKYKEGQKREYQSTLPVIDFHAVGKFTCFSSLNPDH